MNSDHTPPAHNSPDATDAAPRGISRRAALATALAGIGGLGLGAAAGGVAGWSNAMERSEHMDLTRSYPFYDQTHQGGIATPPQRYSMYMTVQLKDSVTTKSLQILLATWSAAISQMQEGKTVGAVQPESEITPPGDTGEAFGLNPASLTITLGLGPGIFGDKFGLQRFKPAAFSALPKINGDATLNPAFVGGDMSIHACADDPQVAYHAVRNLVRIGRDQVATHWTVLGFGRASAGKDQETPRNLFGFKDGTRNVSTDQDFEKFVWIADNDQPWIRGGTYQVARKIKMLIETWDTDRVGDQQQIFGRSKQEGAPLTGNKEFDTPDFHAEQDGKPVIDPTSHIALAAHENNDGIMILRRPYNYTEGVDSSGTLDAGLMFISYQNDPEHFIRLQNKLGASDLMNEYVRHVGSAIFLVPPAPEKGHYIAEALFKS